MMQDDRRDCAALIKHIDIKMTKLANESLNAYGITFMQMSMLMALKEARAEAVPLKSLEKHFEVAQSTAAGIVLRLERKGLVRSCVPADDKRQKHVGLTEKGRELCSSIRDSMQEGERTLLAGLDEDEKVQFYRLLKKVNDAMK